MDLSPTRNQRCSVCNISIRFLSKKIECSNCKSVTCKDHSVLHENSNQFCDNCEKYIIKEQYFSEYIFQIKGLQEDLEYLDRDANKYQNEECKKNDIINILEKQIRCSQASHQERVDIIEKKIIQEQKKIYSEEKLSEYLAQSLTESEKSEKTCAEKIDTTNIEIVNAGGIYEEFLEEEQLLLAEIDVLRSKLRESVPLCTLKLISCAHCYNKLKYQYVKTRSHTSIENSSFLSNISQLKPPFTQTPQHPVTLCRVCNII